jgi:hypothetical protein
MTPTESDPIARRLVALATQRTKRAEAAAEFVVALVLGIIGALLLLHWATPCEAGHLCAMAAITRTRSTLQQRIAAAARRWYLRALIRRAQATLRYQQEDQQRAQVELDYMPHAQAVTRAHIAALHVRLIDTQG